ncbi:hypothetical protein ACWFNS_07520 [Oerskovia enterophila]
MALTAEQVEDVRIVLGLNGSQDIKVVLDAQARLRALFPATEPAEEETKADGLRKCRKKPVEVEAMQYDGKDWRSIAQWMAAHGAPMGRTASGLLRIHTLEGEMTAGSDDWIIRGVQGEFYPCKPDIFAQTYDPASLPVVPAPTETGPWQRIEDVPANVTVLDCDGLSWSYVDSHWRCHEDVDGPYSLRLINDLAPFVAAEEGSA